MPDGDWKIVCHKIDTLTVKVDKIEDNTENSKDRLREAEKQSALQAQAMGTICKKVEDLDGDIKDLDGDVKRINLVSKIIGGIAGGLAVIAAAIGISK
jgi:methyl-accepting chemotaxis protein